jgi:hypothetical protein
MHMYTPMRPDNQTHTRTHAYCFSMATMISRMRLSVKLYEHCITCFGISLGGLSMSKTTLLCPKDGAVSSRYFSDKCGWTPEFVWMFLLQLWPEPWAVSPQSVLWLTALWRLKWRHKLVIPYRNGSALRSLQHYTRTRLTHLSDWTAHGSTWHCSACIMKTGTWRVLEL